MQLFLGRDELVPIPDTCEEFVDNVWCVKKLVSIRHICDLCYWGCEELVPIPLTSVKNWYLFFLHVENWYHFLLHVKNLYQFLTHEKNWYQFLTHEKNWCPRISNSKTLEFPSTFIKLWYACEELESNAKCSSFGMYFIDVRNMHGCYMKFDYLRISLTRDVFFFTHCK